MIDLMISTKFVVFNPNYLKDIEQKLHKLHKISLIKI